MPDNRSAILNAALELFAARGYDAVGVQEIAMAAGITKPTLYHYFGSKLGLLEALFEQYYAEFYGRVKQVVDSPGNLAYHLEQLADTFFEVARQYPVFYRLQLGLVFAPRHSDANRVASKWNEALHHEVQNLFNAAIQEHGNLRRHQQMIAATFIGLLNTCVSLWLNGYLELDEALQQRVLHQFQHGIYS